MTDRVEMVLAGRFPERFIERALEKGVRFETIRRTGVREVRLWVTGADEAAVAALAAELGLKIQTIRREGWPVRWRALRARSTLAAGLALCALLVWLFAGRVWRVDVTPLEGASPEAGPALQAWLLEQGVRPLMSRAAVHPALLSAQLLGRFDNLTYAGVRLRGVLLTVEYGTEDAPPRVYRAGEAGSLVAARDAVVLRVEPLAGKACVKSGDAVKAGQLLVSGEERTGAETTHAVRALGQVIARVWFTGRCEAPLAERVRQRTGRVRYAAALKLFDWRWPLAEAEAFPCQDVETEYLPVCGLYLPVAIERRALCEVVEQDEPADRAALEQALTEQALGRARSQLPDGAQETASWTEVSESDGRLQAEAVIEAEMDIAIQN